MSNYDFKTLNDKEFEIFCADLLSIHFGNRFERFKAGRDGGVDGRYFGDVGEIILQCKHYARTPNAQLIRTLQKEERPKLEKLKPARYLLAVSNELSRTDKKRIMESMSPYLLSESDIFGNEDLNDLLSKHSEIEKRTYKLWLHSTEVLNRIYNRAIEVRSRQLIEESLQSASLYAMTSSHEAAMKLLDKSHVVILTGEPGIGKTTLANHLCLDHVANGYELLQISNNISEAENALEDKNKQIFLFDDFLGSNYLDALSGHEGNAITRFIRRISRSRQKRFILTSRSTILNQGRVLIDAFEHSNMQQSEFELRVDSLTSLECAKILYNHLYHSELPESYRDQIRDNRNYRAVIDHHNFNPRLIAYVTNAARLDGIGPSGYWSFIKTTLDNPVQVWRHPFDAQLDDFGRSCVLLTVLNGGTASEQELQSAYHQFIGHPEHANFSGRREFDANLRVLTGSFLQRSVLNSTTQKTAITLFNPSIGDFLLQRLSKDEKRIRMLLICLRSASSFRLLMTLSRQGHVTPGFCRSIAEEHLRHFHSVEFDSTHVHFVAELCLNCLKIGKAPTSISSTIEVAVRYVLNHSEGYFDEDVLKIVGWAYETDLVTTEEAITFGISSIDFVTEAHEVELLTAFVKRLTATEEEISHLSDALRKRVQHLFFYDIDSLIDSTEAFEDLYEEQYEEASAALLGLLSEKLDDMGVHFEEGDIRNAIDNFGVSQALDEYLNVDEESEENYRKYRQEQNLLNDAIDDLFEKA